MSDGTIRQRVADSLDRLLEAAHTPRALEVSEPARAAIVQAVARTRAQFLGGEEAALVVALVGGTGAGKSTLINALAGDVIAEASGLRRPVTSRITVYHHADLPAGNLPVELGANASFVVHERRELRHLVLVDTPDVDSLRTEHRAVTKALLKAAHLGIYVFEPRRYNDERVWSVLRTEEQFSACAAVLNKTNDRERLQSVAELDEITGDLRHLLGTLGQSDCPLFRISADIHVPGTTATGTPLCDDFQRLRAFLLDCLEDSEIARRIRTQRQRVVEHLEQQVDAVASVEVSERVGRLGHEASDAIDQLAARLEGTLREPLLAVNEQLSAACRWRSVDRFHGPFHYWLLVQAATGLALRRGVEWLSVGGLPSWGGTETQRQQSLIAQLLGTAAPHDVERQFREATLALQSRWFAMGLPVARWRRLTADFRAGPWLDQMAREIQRRFELQALVRQQRKGWSAAVCRTVSVIGGLLPAALLAVGLYGMVRDLYAAKYLGLDLLGHLLAVIGLSFVMLQMLVSILVPSGPAMVRGITDESLRSALDASFAQWTTQYAEDLLSDVRALREPLGVLRAALATPLLGPPTSERAASNSTSTRTPRSAAAVRIAGAAFESTGSPVGHPGSDKPTTADVPTIKSATPKTTPAKNAPPAPTPAPSSAPATPLPNTPTPTVAVVGNVPSSATTPAATTTEPATSEPVVPTINLAERLRARKLRAGGERGG